MKDGDDVVDVGDVDDGGVDVDVVDDGDQVWKKYKKKKKKVFP